MKNLIQAEDIETLEEKFDLDQQWTEMRQKWKNEETSLRGLCEDMLKPKEAGQEKSLAANVDF